MQVKRPVNMQKQYVCLRFQAGRAIGDIAKRFIGLRALLLAALAGRKA